MYVGSPFAVHGNKIETEALQVVLAQITPKPARTWKDVEYNFALHIEYMERAAAAYPGYDLIVFPEDVFQTVVPGIYTDFDITEDYEGIKKIQAKCKELQVWAIIAPWLKNKNYDHLVFDNTALLINDEGKIVYKYKKNFPCTPGENVYPGDGVAVVDGPKGSRIGMIICFDGDFPEVYREARYNGANVIVRVSDYFWPYDKNWDRSIQSAACNNQCYVVACNMVGSNGVTTAFGKSSVIGPDGNIITQASDSTPCLTKADIFPGIVDYYTANSGSFNFINDFKSRGGTGAQMHGKGKGLKAFNAYRDMVQK